MPDIIITPSTGKLEFIDNSAQNIRKHAFSMDEDGLSIDAPLAATSIKAPLNIINVNVDNSNTNYPFVLASGSAVTGIKTLMMDGAGGTYNPFTNIATIDISGNSATTTLSSNSTNLGGVAAASYVTLTGTQTLTGKTITGTFTGNLTGTSSWASNALTATNSTQLNGQAASYYTDINARLGYTPVNKAGDTVTGNLIINGNFSVNGSFTAFSASNVYISSSQLYIEDNILTLNAFSPYLRYAGVEMYDSGSGTLSSLLWDGEADYFFLTGSSVNGKIITGPDGQTNLTANFVAKATAGNKLGNSIIYDNGTSVGIGTTTVNQKVSIYPGTTGGISLQDIDSETRSYFFIDNTNGIFSTGIRTANYYLDFDSSGGAQNAIRFYTGTSTIGTGTERMRIISTGNVGIGTNTPGARLEISSSTAASLLNVKGAGGNGILYVSGSGAVGIGTTSISDGARLTIAGETRIASSAAYFTHLNYLDGGNNIISSANGGSTIFRGSSNNITAMTILGSGNVGIGTSSPGGKFEIRTDASSNYIFSGSSTSGYTTTFTMDDTASYFGHDSSVRSLILRTNSTARLTVKGDGNVGIGTTSPTSKLHVVETTATGSRIQLGSSSTNALMNTNLVNDFLILTAPFSAVPASVSNNNAKWGIKMGGGSIDSPNALEKSACIYAVSEEDIGAGGSGAGYNRKVGLALHTSPFDLPNVERVRINNLGNVGIGVTSPRVLLDLAKANNIGQVLLLGETSANIRVGFGLNPSNAGMRIFSYNHISDGLIEFGGISSDGSTWTRNHRLGLAGGNSFFNEQGGNVGIGIAVPTAPLHVVGVISGSSFTGAGTGLTGTAASLSIGGTAATATTASYSLNTTLTTAATYPITSSWATNAVTALNGGVTSISAGTGIGTSASTGAVTITNSLPNATHTGDVTGATALTIANDAVTTVKILNANVTNAKLANSSVTIGSTAVSLGGTVTTFAGLASVTSTAFVGALTGNASTATNSTQLGGVAAASYVTLNDTQSLTNKTITGTFTGNLTGTASTATTSTQLGGYDSTRFLGSRSSNITAFDFNTLTGNDILSTGAASWTGTSNYPTNAVTGNSYQYGTIVNFASLAYSAGIVQTYWPDNDTTGFYFRQKWATNAWTGRVWQQVLTNANYNSFAPTLTGTGASGNWTITSSWATNAVTALNVGNGTITIAAGTGVGVGTTNTFTTNQSGATTVTITNTGVTAITTNTGLSTNASATGAVTITNTGVTSITTNTGLSTNASATGAVTITNTGVTSNVAGTGISLSGGTGAVTITNSSPNATHTGDVTGATALTIANDAVTTAKILNSNVTLAKIANITAGTILGNNNASAAAAPLALTAAQVATMLSGQTMSIAGNAATATILQTARNIGGVSFNGSADINLPGVNTAGNQNTSGNATTSTTATTANALNTGNSYTGVNFTATGFLQSNSGNIKSDTSFGLLTTTNGAQSVSVKGILLGTSYDTAPGANEIRTTNNTSLYLNARGTGDIQFQTADSLKMMLLSNGSVGIGTSGPGKKLDVEGVVRTRGATGTGGFEIGAATTGTAKWRIEWDSASDSLDFNWVG